MTSITQQYYSLDLIQFAGLISFLGFIIGLIITVSTKNVSPEGTAYLTLIIVAYFFVIWYLGRCFFYKEDHKFISPEEYFDEFKKEELHQHVDSPNFTDYLDQIKDFLSSDARLLLIHSLTGYGKSHLLKEASKSVDEIAKNRITLFLKSNPFNIDKELNKEVTYLIIVDNVDINSEEVKELLSYCKNKDIKIILTFRTCELNEVMDKINGLKHKKIKIEWHENDLIYLLRNIRNRNVINDEAIVLEYSNPYLLFTKLDAVNLPNFDMNKFDILIENLDNDIKACLKSFNYTYEEKENLIINILCITPFPENNDEILNVLKIQTNFKENEIKIMIDNLLKSGLLKIVNHSIRFNSDYLGYLYLFYKIRDYSYQEISNLINGLKFSSNLWYYFPKNIYKNLAMASKIINIFLENEPKNNIHSLKPFFSYEVVNKWIDEEENTNGRGRKERIEYLREFCQIIPKRCIDLLNTYLDSDTPVSTEHHLNYKLNTDDFGPIITQLVELSANEEEIIEIIVKMESKEMNGTYGNYRPNELIKYLVSPFEKNDEKSILKVLNILETFLDNWSVTKINILSSALNEVFSVSKYHEEWGLFKFRPYEVELQEVPEVILIRDKALEILKKMINHDSLEVKIEAIKVAREIGGEIKKKKQI